MQRNSKDIASGAFFVAVGVFYGTIALTSLSIGSALNMGPGYFPIILCAILIVLGGVIMLRGFRTAGQTPFGVVPYRGLFMISVATIVFATFLEDLGLFPTVVATTIIAALSSPQISLLRAALLGIVVAAFCTAVFIYGIGLTVPPIGPWLHFR